VIPKDAFAFRCYKNVVKAFGKRVDCSLHSVRAFVVYVDAVDVLRSVDDTEKPLQLLNVIVNKNCVGEWELGFKVTNFVSIVSADVAEEAAL
jgi:hypothetical protein